MPAGLSRYIDPKCSVADLAESGRFEALGRMVHGAAQKGVVKNEDAALASLIAGETMQSFAVGNCVAILHCLVDEIP